MLHFMPHWAWVCSQQFLTPKIRKLTENLMYFRLYHQGLFGELHQTVLRDLSPYGHKNFGIEYWGSFPAITKQQIFMLKKLPL